MKQLLLVSMCLWTSLSFAQEIPKSNSQVKPKKALANEKTAKSSGESKKDDKIYLPLKRDLKTVRAVRVKTKTVKL